MPRTSVAAEKRRMRSELKARRARLTDVERERASGGACGVLMATAFWNQARTVALFHSMADEVSTSALMASAWSSGRRVALPVTPGLGSPLFFRWVLPETPLVRARYGALEPAATALSARLEELELVVVPGLGFDASGARLGYGGGYYDRTLARTGPGVMLAFASQQVERVPTGPHDVRVKGVATEKGWLSPLP